MSIEDDWYNRGGGAWVLYHFHLDDFRHECGKWQSTSSLYSPGQPWGEALALSSLENYDDETLHLLHLLGYDEALIRIKNLLYWISKA